MKRILLYFSLLFLSSTGFALNVPDMMDELIQMFGDDLRPGKSNSLLWLNVNTKSTHPSICIAFSDSGGEIDYVKSMKKFSESGKKQVFDHIAIGSFLFSDKEFDKLKKIVSKKHDLTYAEAENYVLEILDKYSLGKIYKPENSDYWCYVAEMKTMPELDGSNDIMTEKEAIFIIHAHLTCRRSLEKVLDKIKSIERNG